MIPRFSLSLVLGIVLACGFAPSHAEAQPCGVTNIAQGLPLINATLSTSGGPPSIATDGKGDLLTNYWFSGYSQSFIIDLGARVPICRIVAAVRQSTVVIISSKLDLNDPSEAWIVRHGVDVSDPAHSGSNYSQIDGPLTFEGYGYVARYLKYESGQKGSAANQGLHEFAVYPSVSTPPLVLTGDNLAALPGVTVTGLLASATGFPPSNVADGRSDTKWLGAHSSQVYGGRWQIFGQAEIDLRGEVLVHGVRVRRPAGGGAHSVMVSLFDAARHEIAWFGDGDPAVVGTDTPATGDVDFVLEIPLQVRFVRVVPSNSAVSSSQVRPALAEVEVYGSAQVPEDDTTPPAVSVPGDITAEATGSDGASVSFAATASDDVDGTLPATCVPAADSTFPLGTTTVTCSATDAASNRGTATFTVSVVDTTPPVLTVPPDMLDIEAENSGGAAVTFEATATDLVDGALVPRCIPASGSTFPLGTTPVTCASTDTAGNTATGTFTVTVVDSTPPVIGAVRLNRTELWPPNHQLISVTALVSFSDVDPKAACRVSDIESNEPADGLGDGDTSPDWQSFSDLSAYLRSERAGNGAGRIYTLTIECRDTSNNRSFGTATVVVPRSMSGGARK